nr:CBS domain-containing protein [Paenibacillus bovis]
MKQKLLGIVSAYDLIKKLKTIKTIDEIMEPVNQYLLDTATAEDAIVLIDDVTYGMIPVVDKEHKIVGLVTRGSLLSAMSSKWIEMEENLDE